MLYLMQLFGMKWMAGTQGMLRRTCVHLVVHSLGIVQSHELVLRCIWLPK